MSNSIAANDIIQNIDDLLAEYPVDECISILQEVVKEMDVRIKEYIINKKVQECGKTADNYVLGVSPAFITRRS